MIIREHLLSPNGKTDIMMKGYPLSVNTKCNSVILAEAVADESASPAHFEFYAMGADMSDSTVSPKDGFSFCGSTLINCGNSICYVFFREILSEDRKW